MFLFYIFFQFWLIASAWLSSGLLTNSAPKRGSSASSGSLISITKLCRTAVAIITVNAASRLMFKSKSKRETFFPNSLLSFYCIFSPYIKHVLYKRSASSIICCKAIPYPTSPIKWYLSNCLYRNILLKALLIKIAWWWVLSGHWAFSSVSEIVWTFN